MVTTARYVETTIIHGIKKIVKKNSTLDNNIHIATSASVKSMVETYISLFTICALFVRCVNRIQCYTE